MVSIFRFRAVRPEKGAASRVAAVPYDVVTKAEARAVIRENPESFLRISRPDADHPDLPLHGPEEYARARQRFDELRGTGVLPTDDSPGMYIYRVRSRAGTFTGLCCCLSVDDYESGVIRRHEQTRYDKEEDRTRHIEAVNAHTGPVVLIYRDACRILEMVESLADSLSPAGEVSWHDGSLHQIFRITDAGTLSRIEEMFSSVPRLYIADGHHRAKSAVNVARMRKAAGEEIGEADRFMGVLFAHDGVRIHGYSRLVRDLGRCTKEQFRDAVGVSFSVSPYSGVDRASFSIPPTNPASTDHVVHMYLDRCWYECRAPARPASDPIDALDVSILQKQVMERILGIRDPRSDSRLQYLGGARPLADLEAMVDRGDFAVAFSLQPIRVETVLAIADADGIMPPKSTWFEPKLLSGLVIHPLS
jgi:uncharacterized protein (DUF1015 family)